MWFNKIILKVVALVVCCLSLTGCWGGKNKKARLKPTAPAIYEGQRVDTLDHDTHHARSLSLPSDQSVYYFRLNSHALDAQATSVLYNAAQHLKKSPESNIILEGHADARGPEDFNEVLSQKRADSVKSYLVRQNIDEGRIETYGYSNKRLAASGNHETAHAKNRRVELKSVE